MPLLPLPLLPLPLLPLHLLPLPLLPLPLLPLPSSCCRALLPLVRTGIHPHQTLQFLGPEMIPSVSACEPQWHHVTLCCVCTISFRASLGKPRGFCLCSFFIAHAGNHRPTAPVLGFQENASLLLGLPHMLFFCRR